ncbi:hypothetical protein ACWCZ5_22835 [Streptomyces sp. NPDC001667]
MSDVTLPAYVSPVPGPCPERRTPVARGQRRERGPGHGETRGGGISTGRAPHRAG